MIWHLWLEDCVEKSEIHSAARDTTYIDTDGHKSNISTSSGKVLRCVCVCVFVWKTKNIYFVFIYFLVVEKRYQNWKIQGILGWFLQVTALEYKVLFCCRCLLITCACCCYDDACLSLSRWVCAFVCMWSSFLYLHIAGFSFCIFF